MIEIMTTGELQMSYELKEYLNSINLTKENLMDSDDPMWERSIIHSSSINVLHHLTTLLCW